MAKLRKDEELELILDELHHDLETCETGCLDDPYKAILRWRCGTLPKPLTPFAPGSPEEVIITNSVWMACLNQAHKLCGKHGQDDCPNKRKRE